MRWLFVISAFISVAAVAQSPKLKEQAIGFIEKNKTAFTAWSDSIWTYAEASFAEYKSVKLLTRIFKDHGFTVQENVCGSPTLFIASYGKARPVIGLFGEYDADSGASNKVVPRKEPLIAGGYGHGGAHNLLGVGSVATALAMKELISQGKLNATIRYYGSTAEGSAGTRSWLARDGYFDDLDISLYWHPSPVTWAATGTWDALIDLEVRSDTARLEKLKQSNSPTVQLNYTAFNVRIQCAYQADANNLLEKIRNIADSIKIKRALHQFLPNITAMKAVQANMEKLGSIQYTREEIDFSLAMQQHIGSKPDTILDRVLPFRELPKRENLYGYASDIGEASWIAPEIYFVVKCLPSGISMHTWQNAAFTAHSIGHKGMLQAAKLMSMTIIDYVLDKNLQQAISEEFRRNTAHYKYKPIIE